MKFNLLKSKRPRGLTTNLAGGEAFVETPKLELATLLLTCTLGQGWIGHYAPTSSFEAWKKKHDAAPKVFSFDLQGYGTLQFPQRDVYCLAGFSDKTLATLKQLDSDQLPSSVRSKPSICNLHFLRHHTMAEEFSTFCRPRRRMLPD